jgi:hypothetical protein
LFRKLSQHLNFDSPFLIKAARLNIALSEGRDKESRERPERLIAQIMDIGEWEDECELEETFSDEVLRHILTHAEPGWFRPKSWSFWNYRLKVVPFDAEPPEMPQRSFSA